MESRIEYKSTFIKTYNSWCQGNNFPIMDEGFLPNHVMVVSRGNEDIYALFLFLTSNSKTTMIGFPMANPYVREKYGGLNFLFEHAEEILRNMGYEYILTTSSTKQIENTLQELDYIQGDRSVTQYTKTIWEQVQQWQ